MAGHELDDDPSLKGLSRYFNNKTTRGRANVSKVTISLIALYYVYSKIKGPAPPKNICVKK